jgi:hypothetical protein
MPSMRPLTAPSAINRAAAGLDGSASAWPAETSVGPTEIVVRPKGLRHGLWEAPRWAFWTVATMVVVAAALYALARLGVLRRKAR